MYENRTLVRGDNLDEMRRFPDDCIDLIATDPPFNSNRNYFVPYRDEHGQEPDTLIRAFTDTWTWGKAAEDAYNYLLVEVGGQIGAVRQQFERLFPQHRESVTVIGTPENEEQALRLARNNPHPFEEWCVTHVLKFRSNDRRGADGGIDGTFRFPLGRIQGRQAYGKAVAQVKGGNYTLGHIRDFRTAMQNVEADLGVFIVTSPTTQGMRTETARAGTYRHPFLDIEIPVLQIYEIQDYFRSILPKLPFGERDVL